jgi:CheY-like chemotaxis protein
LKRTAAQDSGGRVSNRNASPPLLLVEDGPLTLLTTKAALEDEGYRVVAARHAAAALTVLTQPVRGLITDIRLPGPLDGWQIAQEARARWADIPVVYVTGEGDADWPAKGVPGSLILQKPYSAKKLLATVAKLLAGKVPVPSRSG